MSEDLKGKQYSELERRSEKRLVIDGKIKATIDWLTSLDERVANGEITNDRRKELIAGSMVGREIFLEKATEKGKKDPMTGLLNRGAYDGEIGKLVRNGLPFGLLIIDVNHFKDVNDTYGHLIGDDILIQTTRRISSNLRQIRANDEQNDQLFRYGGDEFVVLLPGISQENNLKDVAEKIRVSVGDFPYPIRLDGLTIHIPITISIGGGINRQEQAENFFQRVDTQGLYEAKKNGRNRTIIVAAQ